MLFHVTMTHTADDCPAYDPELMARFLAVADKVDSRAKELNITVHNLLWGAPEHVAYALIEADNLVAIGQFVLSFPIHQDFKVTPVEHLSDVVTLMNSMMAHK